MRGPFRNGLPLTFDNRDAGENEDESGTYSIADMADDVIDLFDALEMGHAHVVGHSLGGCIAQQIAVRHPERVDRLVLVDTTTCRRGRPGDAERPPGRRQLKDITAPTLVVHGELDPGYPTRAAEVTAERVPDARLIIYPGVGHYPVCECRDRFHDDLLKFLRESSPAEATGT